jgi:hypothetical protein
MQPRAEPAPQARAAPLLTISSASGTWGIPSSAVASVEQPRASLGNATPSLLALLGIAVPSAEPARVLVLQVGDERLPLLVHGTLTLVETTAGDLLPLPPAVQSLTPLVSHLAVVDGKPALFVVSPERLLQAARDTHAASSSHDSVRGSSC